MLKESASIETPPLPVAVVIPAYNRAALLEQALQSVLSQSPGRPTEVIVVDDCSDDQTSETARAYGADVIRHEVNRGPSAARNTGLKAATQPWVAFLDCDDDWLPHHLQTLWDAREDHLLVAGSSVAWDPSREVPSRVFGPQTRHPRVLLEPAPLLFPENFIVESGVMLRRDAALAIGGYDESWRHSEDLHLWIRLLAQGSAVVLPEVTLRYRVHDAQAVVARDKMRESHVALVTGRDRSSRHLRKQVLAVVHWDEFRQAQRGGDWRAAMAHWMWLIRPAYLLGLLELLLWRFRSRRAAYGFDREGRPSIALMPGGVCSEEIESGRRVFDLRHAGPSRIALALLSRPPGAVIAGKRWHLRVLQFLGFKRARIST